MQLFDRNFWDWILDVENYLGYQLTDEEFSGYLKEYNKALSEM